MSSITEIKHRADIRDVWAALGGGALRRGRGQAFWRSGDGYNISVDARRGLWHDFVTGDGGDVVALVETVRGCSFVEAAEWLASFVGVTPIGDTNGHAHVPAFDPDRAGDLERADYWLVGATALAESALASMEPWDPARRGLTDFLKAIRLGTESLLEEYRAFRRKRPQVAAGMVYFGRLADARLERILSKRIRKMYGAPTS
jgi:hypothetical protein